jgi:hypothetical protein
MQNQAPGDPSDLIRSLSEKLQRDSHSRDIRLHRLRSVCERFAGFADWLRFELSDTAGLLTIATLAEHKDRDAWSAYFNSFVDIAYSTIAAESGELPRGECERLEVAADAIQEHLRQKLNKIGSESHAAVASIPRDSTNPILMSFRMVAEALVSLRTQFSEFTSDQLLVTNIVNCCALCSSAEFLFLGGNNAQDVVRDAVAVVASANACAEYVIERVKCGKLTVVNGKISIAQV